MSLSVAILPWSRLWQKFFKDLLQWLDCSNRLEKVSNVISCDKVLSLMEVSAASVFIWEHVCLGCGDYMADQLDLDFWL